MKCLFLLPFILLTCCSKEGPEVIRNSEKIIIMNPSGSSMHVKVVVLDGNEYYATAVKDGWALCPKLPSKAEKN